MGFNSISEVGNRIVAILKKELVPDVVQHTSAIGLCSPEDHGELTIGVYLYDISPNDDLVEMGFASRDRHTQVYPSTFLTLRYMICVWSMGDVRYRTEEEHRILGRVVQALSDNAVVSQTSSLYGAPMDTRIEMERLDTGEKLRRWSFPSKPYQLPLFYRVQPVEITSNRTRLTPTRVRDISVFFKDVLGDEFELVSGKKSLVVLCTDARTGRPLDPNLVRVTMDHASAPIVKEGNYRIFTGIEGEKTVIRCDSEIYQKNETEVDLKTWDGSEVLEIQLEPGENYPEY